MVKVFHLHAITLLFNVVTVFDFASSWVLSATTTRATTPSKVVSERPPNDDSALDVLSSYLTFCIIQSDLKRESGRMGASTGWTSWVDEASAYRLQQCIDKMMLVDTTLQNENFFNMTTEQDDLVRWLKWIKASPSPMIVELSEQLRSAVNATITPEALEMVEQTYEEVLSRIAFRVVLLPSGASLNNNLRAEAGSMIYGKVLYGGVTRYRLIGASGRKRKAGERTAIASSGTPTRSWLQYGGPERNYDAVDVGPCAFMELTILPKGSSLPLVREDDDNLEMAVSRVQFNPGLLFGFPDDSSSKDESETANEIMDDFLHPDDADYLDGVESRFRTVVGGLGGEIESIVRRVLDGRAMAQNSGPASDQRIAEMQQMLELGLHPVKGLLLYGPPGCGKTELARQLSRLLTDRPPKIVAAPELLDRWVGGSEKLVRSLFGDAEDELRMCNGDITKSGLHVVVIDEVDAVFRKRSSASDSGEVSRASAVNQILAKLDGVNALGNVLVIGTTNRKELLDAALLRPGRLEVQVEVPLPDREGRREILQIHFDPLRRRGRLSKPLCAAIDGITARKDGTKSFRNQLSRLASFRARPGKLRDLAADRWTKDFSGADLAGLVRCAGSIALARSRKDGSGLDGLLLTVEDVVQALEEVTN
jgi:vesicle-fusing ATPase